MINNTRYQPGPTGHYESFFQRANHPTRPLAFWIRYTIFSPINAPDKAIGELWAIVFDGEKGQHRASKIELPFSDCSFSPDGLDVRVGESTLTDGNLKGSTGSITWDLSFTGDQPPLFLLPENLYEGGFPSAKSLVGLPLATYNGTVTVDGETIPIEGWPGSQNHNWGRKHTDRYAWGQVAGFDNHDDTFLEVATAQLKMGPLWTPPITLINLRHAGQSIKLNGMLRGALAKGRYQIEGEKLSWDFASSASGWTVRGHIESSPANMVGLTYYNPPGGSKHCLNTKIASCTLTVQSPDGQLHNLHTAHRAAFEILTDDRDHGIPISA